MPDCNTGHAYRRSSGSYADVRITPGKDVGLQFCSYKKIYCPKAGAYIFITITRLWKGQKLKYLCT